MSNPPTQVLSIFNNNFYENEEFLSTTDQYTSSNALTTNFTGEIDIGQNLEFNNVDYTKGYITGLNKLNLSNNLLVQSGNINASTNVINYNQTNNNSDIHSFYNLNN